MSKDYTVALSFFLKKKRSQTWIGSLCPNLPVLLIPHLCPATWWEKGTHPSARTSASDSLFLFSSFSSIRDGESMIRPSADISIHNTASVNDFPVWQTGLSREHKHVQVTQKSLIYQVRGASGTTRVHSSRARASVLWTQSGLFLRSVHADVTSLIGVMNGIVTSQLCNCTV